MVKQTNARDFIEVSEKYGDHWRRVAIIRCRECGSSESLKISQRSTLLPPAAITKKFRQHGWDVGANEHWDTCPECVAKHKINPTTKEDVEMTTVTPIKTPTPSEAPPRVMQREDKRIIFQKLNEVYLDEKRGYDNGWSDLRVSQDLGIPRAWVAQVRDENFGPAGTNPDIEEFKKGLAELQELKSIIKKFSEQDIPAVLMRIAALEKLANEVRKHVP